MYCKSRWYLNLTIEVLRERAAPQDVTPFFRKHLEVRS